jgi:hypothetical protein
MLLVGKMRKKTFDFFDTQVARMPQLAESNERSYPVNISLLRPETVVQIPHTLAHLIE